MKTGCGQHLPQTLTSQSRVCRHSVNLVHVNFGTYISTKVRVRARGGKIVGAVRRVARSAPRTLEEAALCTGRTRSMVRTACCGQRNRNTPTSCGRVPNLQLPAGGLSQQHDGPRVWVCGFHPCFLRTPRYFSPYGLKARLKVPRKAVDIYKKA